jgi:hypothetical protein
MSSNLVDPKNRRKQAVLRFEKTKRTNSLKAFARSKVARSWSNGSLLKLPSKALRIRTPTDASMNDEWVNIYDEPVFWTEVNSSSALIRAQKDLFLLEERILKIYQMSLKGLQVLFGSGIVK